MHTRIIQSLAFALLLLGASVLVAGPTLAQRISDPGLALGPLAPEATAADTYEVSWWTVNGGGLSISTGGSYSLGGTAGQPDAGPQLGGGGYTLAGGFWNAELSAYRTFVPSLLRQ